MGRKEFINDDIAADVEDEVVAVEIVVVEGQVVPQLDTCG
jgi:hypothetical protein